MKITKFDHVADDYWWVRLCLCVWVDFRHVIWPGRLRILLLSSNYINGAGEDFWCDRAVLLLLPSDETNDDDVRLRPLTHAHGHI